eukprot:tig00001428_g8724.t1
MEAVMDPQAAGERGIADEAPDAAEDGAGPGRGGAGRPRGSRFVRNLASDPRLGGLAKRVMERPWLADPLFFNSLQVRRAVIPAANGHFSARALGAMYACLAGGGVIAGSGGGSARAGRLLSEGQLAELPSTALLGAQQPLEMSGTTFGMGFIRVPFEGPAPGERRTAFGHGGLGGSYAMCDPSKRFALAVVINRMTQHMEGTHAVVNLVCQELGVGQVLRFKEDTTTSLRGVLPGASPPAR